MNVGLALDAGGLAFAAKGKPRPLRDVQARVSLDRQRVTLKDFPDPGSTGVFDESGLAIRLGSGDLRERSITRPSPRKIRWDDFDLLYFVGYALWNYVVIPRRIWDLPHEELAPWVKDDQNWRRVEVRFPEDIHTHSPIQTFYLDDLGQIRRHDYVAEVFGPWARAAHLGLGHVDIAGTKIATRRWVVPRVKTGRALAGPTLVWIRLRVSQDDGTNGDSSGGRILACRKTLPGTVVEDTCPMP